MEGSASWHFSFNGWRSVSFGLKIKRSTLTWSFSMWNDYDASYGTARTGALRAGDDCLNGCGSSTFFGTSSGLTGISSFSLGLVNKFRILLLSLPANLYWNYYFSSSTSRR